MSSTCPKPSLREDRCTTRSLLVVVAVVCTVVVRTKRKMAGLKYWSVEHVRNVKSNAAAIAIARRARHRIQVISRQMKPGFLLLLRSRSSLVLEVHKGKKERILSWFSLFTRLFSLFDLFVRVANGTRAVYYCVIPFWNSHHRMSTIAHRCWYHALTTSKRKKSKSS